MNNIPQPNQSASTDDTPLATRVAAARQAWRRLWLGILSLTPVDLLRILVIILAFVALLWFVSLTWSVLLPFQIGVVLAYLFLPLVNRANAHMPRWAAILLVFAVALAALSFFVAFLVPPLLGQLSNLVRSFPTPAQINAWVTEIESWIATLPEPLQQFIEDGILQGLTTIRNNALNYIRTTAAFITGTALSIVNTFSFIIGFLVVPFWLFFVLNDHEKGVRSLNMLLPAWLRLDFWALIRIVDRTLSSYLRGQIFLGVLIAIVTYLGLVILQALGVGGIQAPIALALFAGVMELVPFIGPIIGAIPAVLLGLFDSVESGIAIALLFLVIQQLEGNILVPRVTGDSVNIHPAILMMLLVAVAPFGLIWMILSAPLAAILRDIYMYVYGRLSNPPRPAGLLPREPLPQPVVESVAEAEPVSGTPSTRPNQGTR